MARPLKGSSMKLIDLSYFFKLGFVTNEVIQAVNNHPVNHASLERLRNASKWLEQFVGFDLEHSVFIRSKEPALDMLASLRPLLDSGEEITQLTDEQLTKFNTAAMRLNFELKSEANNEVVAYSVSMVGAYSSVALLEKAEAHLSKKAQEWLTEEIKQDFKMAAKCLAFELFTACGFHALRAVEAVAQGYHHLVTGNAAVGESLGPLINGLRNQLVKEEGQKASDTPLGLNIAELARINKIFRHRIMHPGMTLNGETAKLVFDLAANVISWIADDSETRSRVKP
jgi:hypothetical protein